jgi:hypothetical protein
VSRTHRERAPLSLFASTNECPSGKFAHPTRKGAKEHASNARRRTGEHVRPYRCPICDLWHVGHLPRAVVRGEVSSDQAYGRAPLDQGDQLYRDAQDVLDALGLYVDEESA